MHASDLAIMSQHLPLLVPSEELNASKGSGTVVLTATEIKPWL